MTTSLMLIKVSSESETFNIGKIIGTIALFIALFATLIAIICYLPGAIRVMKTKDTRGLSLPMYLITGVGCIVWIIVGILYLISSFLEIQQWQALDILRAINAGIPIIISNLSLGTCCFILVWMKRKNIKEAHLKNMTEEVYVSNLVKKHRALRLKKLLPKFVKLKNQNHFKQWLFKQTLMDEELIKIYLTNIKDTKCKK